MVPGTGELTYTVKAGDTLFTIAKAHGISLEELISANHLETSLIYPNQILVIPKEAMGGSIYFEEYVTEAADTIEGIAQKIGVSPELLVKYNDITKLILQANQVIRIPRMYQPYVIQPGDTLESILAKTGMTLEQLVIANAPVWLAPGNTILIR